jgi:hypothetical protein
MRHHDLTGVSGVGTVAGGVEFTDGTVCLRWNSSLSSVAYYKSISDVNDIHGHDGLTKVEWCDYNKNTFRIVCYKEDLLGTLIDHPGPLERGSIGEGVMFSDGSVAIRLYASAAYSVLRSARPSMFFDNIDDAERMFMDNESATIVWDEYIPANVNLELGGEDALSN